MKGTAGATVKIGAIQKDARTLNESGGRVAILVGLGNAVFALVLELPLVGRKAFCGLLDSLDVLLVDEVGSVTAAPFHQFFGGTRQDPLASVSEDTGPVALEECDVKDPRTLLIGIFKTDPFMGFQGCFTHEAKLVLVFHEIGDL